MSSDLTVKIEAPDLTTAIRELIGVLTAAGTLVASLATAQSAQATQVVADEFEAATQITTTEVPGPQSLAAVPAKAPTYSLEHLAVAATTLVDAGRRQELVELLATFGVTALTQLPKEQYGVFATRLREMGARV